VNNNRTLVGELVRQTVGALLGRFQAKANYGEFAVINPLEFEGVSSRVERLSYE